MSAFTDRVRRVSCGCLIVATTAALAYSNWTAISDLQEDSTKKVYAVSYFALSTFSFASISYGLRRIFRVDGNGSQMIHGIGTLAMISLNAFNNAPWFRGLRELWKYN